MGSSGKSRRCSTRVGAWTSGSSGRTSTWHRGRRKTGTGPWAGIDPRLLAHQRRTHPLPPGPPAAKPLVPGPAGDGGGDRLGRPPGVLDPADDGLGPLRRDPDRVVVGGHVLGGGVAEDQGAGPLGRVAAKNRAMGPASAVVAMSAARR